MCEKCHDDKGVYRNGGIETNHPELNAMLKKMAEDWLHNNTQYTVRVSLDIREEGKESITFSGKSVVKGPGRFMMEIGFENMMEQAVADFKRRLTRPEPKPDANQDRKVTQ